MLSRLPLPRVLAVAGLIVLTLSACGRRGALEPPPGPAAAQVQTQEPGTLPSPVGTPRKTNRGAGFTVPNRSFILDPLL